MPRGVIKILALSLSVSESLNRSKFVLERLKKQAEDALASHGKRGMSNVQPAMLHDGFSKAATGRRSKRTDGDRELT